MRDALIKLGYFLLVLLVLYAVWSFFFRIMGNNNIDELLRKTDIAIENQDYTQAYRHLRSINRHRLDAYHRLRILARAFELADRTNDFKYLEKESASAVAAYGDREDFKAFYILALTENNNVKNASKLAQKYLHNLRFKDIRARAILSELFKNAEDPFTAAEEQLINSADIAFYTQMAEMLNEPILYFNIAVLHLMNNQLEEAKKLSPLFIHSTTISVTKRALLAYELGDYALAFTLLDSEAVNTLNSIEAVLLLADLHLLRGNQLLALELYRTALSIDPQFTPIAWLNVALLTEYFIDSQDQQNIYTLLSEGYRRFPNHTLLFVSRINQMTNQVEAERQMNAFNQQFPQNAYSYLFWLNHFDNTKQLETISSKLWDLFNHNPTDEKLTRYMVWFFLGQRNFADAKMVLTRYQGANRSWITSYEALIFALNKDFAQASLLLEQSDSSWINLYNHAIILITLHQNESAIQKLITAATLYNADAKEKNSVQLAQIHAKLAQAYWANGNMSMAQSAAYEALRIDAENVEALRLLQEITRER